MKPLLNHVTAHRRAYAMIALAPATLVAALTWAAGLAGPAAVSGDDVADALEYNAGTHAGYRRAHAKGMCFTGRFDANGKGARLSRAAHLQAGTYRVEGRFSIAGAIRWQWTGAMCSIPWPWSCMLQGASNGAWR